MTRNITEVCRHTRTNVYSDDPLPSQRPGSQSYKSKNNHGTLNTYQPEFWDSELDRRFFRAFRTYEMAHQITVSGSPPNKTIICTRCGCETFERPCPYTDTIEEKKLQLEEKRLEILRWIGFFGMFI
jgi:hypothetical protein